MERSFKNACRIYLASTLALMLFTVAGCSSVSEVKPPDPMQSNVEGQIRQFEGFTPQQVLAAAEVVLHMHKPKGKFVRSADALEMEAHERLFIFVAMGDSEEKWTVHAWEGDQVTFASVAMEIDSVGAFIGFAGHFHYPQKAKKIGVFFESSIEAVDVDYGMFWHRVQSILAGVLWPECEKAKFELGFRFYEPLCVYRTLNRYEAK